MQLGTLLGMLLVKPGKGKLGRAKMLLVVLVLMGPREGLDLGPGSMGPAIDHEGLDTGLDHPYFNHEQRKLGMGSITTHATR